MSGLRGLGVVIVATAVLAGCSAENSADEPALPDPPAAIPAVTGEPGSSLELTASFDEGDVVQTALSPLPQTTCGNEKFVMTAPDGSESDLLTLDAWTRISSDGQWTWAFEPCEGDTTAYTILATPGRQLPLVAEQGPVELEKHDGYVDVATFTVPRDRRAVLVGSPSRVLDPAGQLVPFSPEARHVILDGRRQAGLYTIVGTGEFALIRPIKATASLDETVRLTTPEDQPPGEFEVAFSVPEDTWLTAPLHGWRAGSFAELPQRSIEATDGSTEGNRLGGGMDGLWHLPQGSYVARVVPSDEAPSGNLDLTPLSPTEITRPGRYTLSTSPEGDPALAVFDLPGTHPISVVQQTKDVPWLLTWTTDEAPPECTDGADCPQPQTIPSQSWFPTMISDEGYLALSTSDSDEHTVTVLIGPAQQED